MRFVALLVALWVMPVVAAVVWARPDETDSPRDVVRALIPVGERRLDGDQSGTITFEWTEDRAVESRKLDGLVTDIFIEPGQVIESGTPILEIDGVARLALVGGRPFHRTLGPNDAGLDVIALDALLLELGIAEVSTLRRGAFSGSTTEAVRRLATLIGSTDRSGRFEPSWFVFLREDETSVGVVDVGIGDSISTGDQIYGTPQQLRSATVIPSGPASSKALISDGPVIVTLGERSVELPSLELDLPTVLADLTDSGWAIPPDTQQRMVVVDGIKVRRAEAVSFGSVPAAAVLTDQDASSCVIVALNDGSYEPVEFDPAPNTEAGVVLVAAALIGKQVVSNPEFVPEASCR
jgi:hypothetical protein